MKRLTFDDLFAWSVFNVERQVDLSGHLWVRKEGNILIDPVPMSAADLEQMRELGRTSLCIITNRDHVRAAAQLRDELGFEIAAHAADADNLGLPIARRLGHGDEIVSGLFAIHLAHGKSPGEIALWMPRHALVIVGDILCGDPVGSVTLLPDVAMREPAKAALELRKILRLPFEHLLVGHGHSLFRGAREAVIRCLEERHDIELHRINPDEVAWTEVELQGRYSHEYKDLSTLVGARKLSYNLRRIPPGGASGPTHFHDLEEEVFMVLEGRCELQTPHGVTPLNDGDIVACPPGEAGTHTLRNPHDEPCTVLCMSDVVEHDRVRQTGLLEFRSDMMNP